MMQFPAAAEESITHCVTPTAFARFDLPLKRTADHLASKRPLTIAALGSSSTAGAGASSAKNTYPSRLADELTQLFPTLPPMTVLNRGINGDQAVDMLARFDQSIATDRPDLVLWQLGTNAVLRGDQHAASAVLVRNGIQRMRSIGADVILINPQFAPKVIVKAPIADMIALISSAAKQERVDLFERFALMQYWHDTKGMPFEAFLSSDELHMNDWSYGCMAKVLASAIADAAAPHKNRARNIP